VVAFLALLALATAGAPASNAAVCLSGQPSVSEEFRSSDAVFVGYVISERAEPESKNYFDGDTYVVRIEEPLRGLLRGQIRLFSENSSGRFPMIVGAKYLLFVYRELGRTMVDACGNSGLVSERSEALSLVRRLKSELGLQD
jgi:hypothetical protein